jgi:hypothetical protein
MIEYCWEEVNYLQSVTCCGRQNGEATQTYLGRLIKSADTLSDDIYYHMPIKVQWYLNTCILGIIRGWRHEKNGFN